MSALCSDCGRVPAGDALDGLCCYCWQDLKADLQVEERQYSHGRHVAADCFKSIKVEPTRWLWQDRVPLGTVTLLVGREKLGKSTLTVELAARLSRGDLDGHLRGQSAGTLLVSYEDSAARTITPRLMAAGADLARVHRLRATDDGAPDLVSLPGDVERIGELASRTRARLLVVDPLSASLGAGVDGHRDQDIRRALAPLVQLAEDADLAVIVVAHWNKAQSGDALSRVLGSRGLTAAVRSVLAFGRPPDADEGSPERVLAHAACNVGPEAASLSCRIEAATVAVTDESIPTSRLVVGDVTAATADDLLVTRSESERSDRELAAEWLADELADGDWRAAQELVRLADVAGHSKRTLYRALEALAVQTERRGFPARAHWRLAVVPDESQVPGTTGDGTTAKPPVDTEDSASSDLQSCQSSKEGTTGTEPSPPGPVGRLAKLRAERDELNREMELNPAARTPANYARRDDIARKMERLQ
jgi:hypothetical protein